MIAGDPQRLAPTSEFFWGIDIDAPGMGDIRW
jgi:hypothetical protein